MIQKVTPKIDKLYKEALANVEFNKDYFENDKEAVKPTDEDITNLRCYYTMVYWGWLIGKGIANESNYEI